MARLSYTGQREAAMERKGERRSMSCVWPGEEVCEDGSVPVPGGLVANKRRCHGRQPPALHGPVPVPMPPHTCASPALMLRQLPWPSRRQ
jgi:hypothetical protein